MKEDKLCMFIDGDSEGEKLREKYNFSEMHFYDSGEQVMWECGHDKAMNEVMGRLWDLGYRDIVKEIFRKP